MFWTDTKRIFKAGFIGFWRNGFVSLAAILVMTATLFVVGSLIFTGAVLNSSLQQLKEKVDVNVYFTTTAPEEEILKLKGEIEALPEVASVEYVSRDQALADFRTRHENDELILRALDEIGSNPLGAVLNVRAKETSQYESIAAFLQDGSTQAAGNQPIIEKVNYAENKAAIEKLTSVIDSGEKLGLSITIVLMILSVMITFNTIRLAIYTSREEISIMQLVGASNRYVRGPFVVGGILSGILSAAIVLGLFYPITFGLGQTTESFFGGMNLFSYYLANFGQILLIILGAGVILGGLSSWLAVRKYLKV
jgi:cell division transport system permease protein